MKKPLTCAAALVAAAVALSACAKKPAEAPKAEPAPATQVAMAPGHGAPAESAGASVTGTVLETMDSGGYTYIRLKTSSGETWAAVNQSKVETGSEVTVAGGMTMVDFESPTLKRKFDSIVFGTLAAPGAGGAPAVPAEMAAQHAAAAAGPADVGKIEVAKAEGPDGRTVAALHGERAALNGKTVLVRGKVVKFLGGIMGKNWVHLRDGSGSREGKDDDLTVTTAETVEVGAVVLAKGTVGVDRDFGSGYRYAVILEDASFTKK